MTLPSTFDLKYVCIFRCQFKVLIFGEGQKWEKNNLFSSKRLPLTELKYTGCTLTLGLHLQTCNFLHQGTFSSKSKRLRVQHCPLLLNLGLLFKLKRNFERVDTPSLYIFSKPNFDKNGLKIFILMLLISQLNIYKIDILYSIEDILF